MWPATDLYPQGKDLYGAALPAERCRVDLTLVRDLPRTDLRVEADTFDTASVLDWNVAWALIRKNA